MPGLKAIRPEHKILGETYTERKQRLLHALRVSGSVHAAAKYLGISQGHYISRIAPEYGIDVKKECAEARKKYRLPPYEEILRK